MYFDVLGIASLQSSVFKSLCSVVGSVTGGRLRKLPLSVLKNSSMQVGRTRSATNVAHG